MKRLFALACLVCTTNAMASWLRISSDDQSEVFVESNRIVRDARVTVWTLTNYRATQSADGVSFRSVKARNQFDCAAETRQQLAAVRYERPNGNGQSLYSNYDVQEVRPVVPGSLADGMLKLVCSSATSGQVQPWVKFGENERMSSYFEPLGSQNGDLALVWVLFDYREEQVSPKTGRRYFSEKGQREVDCRNERTRSVFFTWHVGHMGNGKVVYTSSANLPWEPNSPGGIGRALAARVCSKR